VRTLTRKPEKEIGGNQNMQIADSGCEGKKVDNDERDNLRIMRQGIRKGMKPKKKGRIKSIKGLETSPKRLTHKRKERRVHKRKRRKKKTYHMSCSCS